MMHCVKKHFINVLAFYRTPDFSMSFDEVDFRDPQHHSTLKKTWSLQDIISSESASDEESPDSDAETVQSPSGPLFVGAR